MIAIIPARSGSKRIKDKNIRLLGGKPLMQWAVDTAKQCPSIHRIILSTDSNDYIRLASGWGIDPVLRPPGMAQDDSTDVLVLGHILQTLGDDSGEFFIYLRPTTPFRNAKNIENAIEMLLNARERPTGLRSVELMGESSFKGFMRVDNYLRPILWHGDDLTDQPNQACPQTWKANGYVDIARVSEVRAGRLWGNRVIGFVTPHTVEIDDEEDFKYARWILGEES